jgi:hypothetical protein
VTGGAADGRVPRSALVEAVGGYAARVLPVLLENGGAASPLAPWVLAALAAPAARGAERSELEEALGLPAGDALSSAAALLEGGPAGLRTAVAAWRSPLVAAPEGSALAALEAALPAAAARGTVPDQPAADAWAERSTGGAIRRFPATIRPDALAILAAAVAARITWDGELAAEAGVHNEWGLAELLHARPVGVTESPAGLVGVARAGSFEDQVDVYSFIAEPGVPRAALVAAACGLLADWHRNPFVPRTVVENADLPETGHAWTVRVEPGRDTALVPAFAEAAESVDIGALPAVAGAARVLGALVGAGAPPELRPIRVDASMSSAARYDRYGFEGASVAAAVARSAGVAVSPPARAHLHLRFTRPHLAIAVATGVRYGGLPLFAAWVDAGVCEPEPRRPYGARGHYN